MSDTSAMLKLPTTPQRFGADQRVSILVATYNRANYIAECLDSLLGQTAPPMELIVIDDGSEDGTAELLRSYGERIRYVRKENGGKPSAINLGLSLAKGDLIWIFDDDDVALPDAIETRLTRLADSPDADFVYSGHYYGHDGADGKIERSRMHPVPAHEGEAFFHALLTGCFFSFCSALVKADLYRQVGGLDPELFSSEDYDIALRMAQRAKVVFSPSPSFIVRLHQGPRGARAVRYAGNQRGAVFRRFDRQVGQKLRVAVPLGDYLLPRLGTVLPPQAQRQALLVRMSVMASKGCIAELFDDVEAFLKLLTPGQPMQAQEIAALEQLVCTGYAGEAAQENWSEFRDRAQALQPLPGGQQTIQSLCKGFLRLAKSYPGSWSERIARLRAAASLALLR